MYPKNIFAVLGILCAVGSFIFVTPHLVAVGLIFIGVAEILPPRT